MIRYLGAGAMACAALTIVLTRWQHPEMTDAQAWLAYWPRFGASAIALCLGWWAVEQR